MLLEMQFAAHFQDKNEIGRFPPIIIGDYTAGGAVDLKHCVVALGKLFFPRSTCSFTLV